MTVSRCVIAALAVLVSGCGGGGGGGNEPPRLSGLDSVVISANETSPPVPFSVLDDGDPGAVTVTAQSNDEALLPSSAVQFGGSASRRTLTLTPVPGQLGSLSVLVTARDSGGLQATAMLTVTVTAQQVSFSNFVRDAFADEANATPREVNSRRFDDDAGEDAFADLVANP
jgi:hypothetical protein